MVKERTSLDVSASVMGSMRYSIMQVILDGNGICTSDFYRLLATHEALGSWSPRHELIHMLPDPCLPFFPNHGCVPIIPGHPFLLRITFPPSCILPISFSLPSSHQDTHVVSLPCQDRGLGRLSTLPLGCSRGASRRSGWVD